MPGGVGDAFGPGLIIDRAEWPHGPSGPAIAHGAVLWPPAKPDWKRQGSLSLADGRPPHDPGGAALFDGFYSAYSGAAVGPGALGGSGAADCVLERSLRHTSE